MSLIAVTNKIIEQGKSDRGGWSREQVEALGVPWPLEKGWKRRVVGTMRESCDIVEFLTIRNQHLDT